MILREGVASVYESCILKALVAKHICCRDRKNISQDFLGMNETRSGRHALPPILCDVPQLACHLQDANSPSRMQLPEPRRSVSRRISANVMLKFSPLDPFDTVSDPERLDELDGLAGTDLA